jgi:5-formyltetrahydrofolate cyclo-ligase
MTTKAQLRGQIEARRHALDARWIGEASRRIAERLLTLEVFRSAETVALYKAIEGEVDLEYLFAVCWDQGKRTSIPVFNSSLNAYELASITEQTHLITGNYGIQEPEHPSLMPVADMDLIIVPGVAFDTNGNRLGRGGGYYDRLLNGFSGIKAAVAFECQLFPEIPHAPYDIPVHCIVTESKVVDVCNER